MRYLEFQDHFKLFIVISLAQIRLIEPEFDNRRLVEWQQKGYLTQLRRGYYIFSDKASNLAEEGLFLIANKIYVPSYVSLETALHYYNFIPETPFTVTSVSSRKTQQFQTNLANFSYRSVKPALMTGYRLVEVEGNRPNPITSSENCQYARLAVPEKALLDYLYLNPKIEAELDFEALRLNQEEIKTICDFARFAQLLDLYSNKALNKRAEALLGWLGIDIKNITSP